MGKNKIKDIAKKLVKLQDGKTLREFGNQVGIGQSTLHNYLHGRDMKASAVVKICRSLKVDANWLLGLKDEPKEGKLTACQECKHAKIEGYKWHHQYCLARGRNKSFDSLYGKMIEGDYPHTREFNKGHCTMFEPKQSA